jgi:hypothetical protein
MMSSRSLPIFLLKLAAIGHPITPSPVALLLIPFSVRLKIVFTDKSNSLPRYCHDDENMKCANYVNPLLAV